MSLITDKPLFTLKQLLSSITIALTIGGGVARFEYRSNSINDKLDNIINIVADYKRGTDIRLEDIENNIANNTSDIRSITTSITAMIRPDNITIKKYK